MGANDGIISTASLLLGVVAANASHSFIIITGVAGLIAGSLSMAAGEFISVYSQADTEKADIALERKELSVDYKGEHKELVAIYVQRGLDTSLAKQVADQLMANNALDAHIRDELGITKSHKPRPTQAALASAASFAIGALLPLLLSALNPDANLILLVIVTSIFFLAVLGGIAAYVGGASIIIGVMRVTLCGAITMAITALIGSLFKIS